MDLLIKSTVETMVTLAAVSFPIIHFWEGKDVDTDLWRIFGE
jgi:hypothetical protein